MDEDRRPEPPLAASPVEMLSAFLDFQRATLLWKMSGLDDEQVRRPIVRSGTSLLAMLKHSAHVERWWFQVVFAGRDVPMIWTREDPDADWRLEDGETQESIVSLYQQETAISRELVAGRDWNEVAKIQGHRASNHTLGWILSHMVEEVARHVGQADIIREQIDGATGE